MIVISLRALLASSSLAEKNFLAVIVKKSLPNVRKFLIILMNTNYYYYE